MQKASWVLGFVVALGGIAGCSSNAIDAPAGSGGSADAGVGDDAPSGDAGGHVGPTVVTCAALPALASGSCEVTAGGADKLLVGTVLVPGTVYRGGAVHIDAQGSIACVGCDCAAAAASATKVVCPQGVISPGLINTHDHITFSQNDPAPDTGERYEHRHDWRGPKNGHTKISVPGAATKAQITWGELRFLLGGATSTVGSGSAAGLLRNLDSAAQELGLGQSAVDFDTFPLGDQNATELTSTCAYPKLVSAATVAAEDSYLPHVAEGIGAAAANEFACLSSTSGGGVDVVLPQSSFIHAIGLGPAAYAAMAAKRTSLIWSPRSNVVLYGDTARVAEASRLGVRIALGTDWIASGSMNLLRELRCADGWNRTYADGAFTDEDLWKMVTSNAAAATATDDVIGTLAAGKVADVTIFDGRVHDAHRAVIDADPADVVLVLRAGAALYGDDAVVTALAAGGACDAVDVCGSAKRLCISAEAGQTYDALKASAARADGTMYAAFFCGDPPGEPTCVPRRPTAVSGSTVYTGVPAAGDADGDGIADTVDLCPRAFDPVRPLDSGKQADADGDGVGDACDPCPLDANTTACKPVDLNDSDGDTVPNATDNCPQAANTDQADADTDGKGDACDACPNAANAGALACPATIYDVKRGTVATGAVVSLASTVVTAVAPTGFFLQVKPGDPGYAGVDDSAVFVYQPSPTAKAGDRVSLTSATVAVFGGETQLSAPSVHVDASSGEAPPEPTLVTPDEVATGGARAGKLEAALVRVADVSVTDAAPAPGAGDVAPTHEFVVGGALRVDDLLFLATPFPPLGTSYASVGGVLVLRNANSKVEPRSAADLVAGHAVLAAFGPAASFVEVGQAAAPSFPTALSAALALPVATDTWIAIVSAAPGSVGVVGGGVTVPAGQASALVLLDGLLSSAGVTLTASLAGTDLTASVAAIDAEAPRQVASIAPSSVTIVPGATTTLTVALDVPAPSGGTTVTLGVSPSNAGTLPASVVVPHGQLVAAFSYTDASLVSSATVTATLGASTAQATVNVAAGAARLVLNELDYDQVGTDSAEFVELYNGTGAAVSLAGYTLYFVNGGASPATSYRTVSLAAAGTLAAGQYLVVGDPTVTPAQGALFVATGAATDAIQNGPPDGVALVDATRNALVDALSYEGAITSVSLAGVGAVSLVEGTALAASVADSNTVAGSLCRKPNGIDTHDSAHDWAICSTVTPGAANP